MAAITVTFTNLDEFKIQWHRLTREQTEPLNKEFAYLIKQQGDARDLVPRLTGNLQETAVPLDWQSAQYDGKWAYITYLASYSSRVWYGVNFVFTKTENINARAKWLEPVLYDTLWVHDTLKKLFKKHIIDQGSRNYGRFIKSDT